MVNPVVAILALIIMILAAMMIFARNPITSAFCLVSLMLALGGIYGLIGAHFVAAMQVIVYAGAVMVLFVFSIMLMNLNLESKRSMHLSKGLFAFIICAFLFAVLAHVFMEWPLAVIRPPAGPYNLAFVKSMGGNVQALSLLMFSQGYLVFEFVGLLLPIAVCGAFVMAKRKVD